MGDDLDLLGAGVIIKFHCRCFHLFSLHLFTASSSPSSASPCFFLSPSPDAKLTVAEKKETTVAESHCFSSPSSFFFPLFRCNFLIAPRRRPILLANSSVSPFPRRAARSKQESEERPNRPLMYHSKKQQTMEDADSSCLGI